MRVSYGSWDRLVVDRLDTAAQTQDRVRQKIYSYRRLVAGDRQAIGGLPSTQEDDPKSGAIGDLYDFIMEFSTEGASNRLLEAIRVLLFQSCYRFPRIEFEDLEPVQAAINGGACKVLMGDPPLGCNAVHHMRQALLDYLIGGIGWSDIDFDPFTSAPVLRNADSLDVSWDSAAGLAVDARWASKRVRKTAGYWLEHFGLKVMKKIMPNVERMEARSFDQAVELEFYHDRDGNHGQGTHYVFRRQDRWTVSPEVIFKSENPFYYEFTSGTRIPYLPLTPCYFMQLPSTRNAISVVEMMLPDQLSLWKVEKRMHDYQERGEPYVAIQKGSLDARNKERWAKGRMMEGIEIEKGEQAPSLQGPPPPPESWILEREYREKRIDAVPGVNPYAGGDAPEVDFSREVAAIENQAGLTVGVIASDHARHWVDGVRKFLGALRLYGNMPLAVRYDEITMEYGPDKPVAPRIVPDADIAIQEDSTVYRSRQQRMAEALADLKVAMSLADKFPAAVGEAYQDYLVAGGHQNIKQMLEPPQQQPAMAGIASGAPQAPVQPGAQTDPGTPAAMAGSEISGMQ